MARTEIFAHAFKAMPSACALVCEQGLIKASSARFDALFGSAGEPGQYFRDLYQDKLDGFSARALRGAISAEPGAGELAILVDAHGAPFAANLTTTAVSTELRLITVEPSRDAGRKREAMTLARQRIGATFESDSAGAYSVDFAARTVVVSGLLDRFFGPETGHEPISLSRWLSIIHPDDLAAMRRELAGPADDPLAVISVRCRMQTQAGVWVWMRHDMRVVERDSKGGPKRISGLVHDIAADDEGQLAERLLPDRLALAVDGLELSSWEFDFDTLEGEIEGPITAVLGGGKGSMRVGEAVLRGRLHPDDAERVHAAFMGMQFGGQYDETFRVLSPEGYWLWYRSWGQLTGGDREEARGRHGRRAFGFWQQLPGQRDDIAAPLDSDIADVLDRSGLSGWSYDFQTRLLTLSGPVRAALGLSEDKTIMPIEQWRERVHPADHAQMDAATDRLVATGSTHVEYRVRTAGGNWIWLSLRGGISAQTADGDVLRASGVFAEATRRKEAERQLADSERLLSHALSSASLGAWELDFKTQTFLPRGEIRAFLGLGREMEWLPVQAWLELVQPDDRRALNATIRAIMEDDPGRVRTVEYRMLDPRTGEYLWAEGRGSRLGAESLRADCAGIVLDISDRKALEASLAHSEERLARALENARQGTWRVDIPAGMLELSDLTCRIIGLPAGHDGQLSVEEWRARVHPDDLDRYHEAVERMQHGEPVDMVYRMNAGDAGWRWVEDRGATTLRDAEGHALETIGTLVDITRRRELELELIERERRLGEAMDAGLSAIWSIDHETGEQSVRGRLLEWMGRDIGADKVAMEDWKRIIHPDDREIARKALADLMSGRSGGPIDYRLRFGDGWRWVRAQGEITARDSEGRPTRSGGVVVDITAEREYAEALNIERERLSKVYRTTPVMMVSIDPAGDILAVSEYWLEYLGYKREQVIGRPYTAFLTPASANRMEEIGGIKAVMHSGSMREVTARMVKANGEVIDVVSSATVEYGPEGEPIAAHGISIDITEQLAQARDLKHYAEELERTNRELDRFAAIASHDLQEPLRKISAFASLIKRRHQGQFDHETDRSLDFLVDAAGRMRRLIDDLLTYSRASKRALESHRVDMGEITRELVSELEILVNEAKARIEIGELPAIEGDPTLLRLLMQNLITNGLKYRKDAGVTIAISAVRENNHWRFTVRDNGIGLDPRFSEKIFAPFQRLHGREEYEGTGIGLAICQQAVERHGGRIWVESSPGSGSSFHFTLPAGRAELTNAA